MSYKEIVNDDSLLEELYKKEYYQYKSDTKIDKPDSLEGNYLKLSSNQQFAANFISPQSKNNRILNMGQAGCHPANTPILMCDFSVKMAQDIKVGDLLMGADTKPRRVEYVGEGFGDMYKIKPQENDAFVCNEDHILSLYSSKLSKYLDISVKDYLKEEITLTKLGYYLYLDPILNCDDYSLFNDDKLNLIAKNPYEAELINLYD